STASAISRNVARGCVARHARIPPTTALICSAHRASSASQSVRPITVLLLVSGYLTQYRAGHPGSGPATIVRLSLAAVFRRAWPSAPDALADGEVDADRCRELVQ